MIAYHDCCGNNFCHWQAPEYSLYLYSMRLDLSQDLPLSQFSNKYNMLNTTLNSKKLGLYVHIPFCTFMCHYCDFAKTANWDDSLIREYVRTLNLHLEVWLQEFVEKRGYSVDTLFVGGGTPGLLGSEFETLFRTFDRYKISFTEASIEVNPENVTEEKLFLWKSFGFNRLSMGMQSFQEKGLKALTRQHTPQQLRIALEKTLHTFDNVNCDLIYAWHGQNINDWKADLASIQEFPISHLSLYCLTMEQRTPFGRAHSRGVFGPENDVFQEECYEYARNFLQTQGWEHYECSNWSRPGKNCAHNAKYWQDEYFVGLGAGACGYVPSEKIGLRYAYTRKERVFTKGLLSDHYKTLPNCEFETRTAEDWLMEYVGCGLRYKEGIDLERIASKTGCVFKPHGLCELALSDGRLRVSGSRLYLAPSEWIRETRWCLEVLKSFVS